VSQCIWGRPGEEVRPNQLRIGKTLARKAEGSLVNIKADERTISGAQRGENTACAAAKLYNWTTRCRSGRTPEVQIAVATRVEIALVIKEALTPMIDQRFGSQRIVSPAAFRLASELITSRAARFAIIAVDSAQS